MARKIVCQRIGKKDVPDKRRMFLKGGNRERARMSKAHHIYTYKGRDCNLITFISDNGRCTWDCNRKDWVY